ncbi:hypothetical protein KY285_014302 [Solanum tuberosum]|nr:hypothetical protein KY285_014302 [Solanum tuberosum]
MAVLHEYEKVSGQLINKEKSPVYMFSKVATAQLQEVEEITGVGKGTFPFKYLGCPIFHSRKEKVYYNELIKKVKDKLQNWKGRLLSYGGKAVLINSVLQSMPIYLLSALFPTKYTIEEIHKVFARFFWSNKEEGKSRHWASWKSLCLPKEEGGLAFRDLFDVSKALFAKLWWKFRTTRSMWSNFMWNKYCKKFSPALVQWKGGSQLWKKMLEARDNIEQEIWWETRNGCSRLGPLTHIVREDFPIDEGIQDINYFMEEHGWNVELMHQKLPEEIVEHVTSNIIISENSDLWDRPWWMATGSGKFSVKNCGGKISVDEALAKCGVAIASRCICCDYLSEETGSFARSIWLIFSLAVGLQGPFVQINQTIALWWSADGPPKLKPILQAALPSFAGKFGNGEIPLFMGNGCPNTRLFMRSIGIFI